MKEQWLRLRKELGWQGVAGLVLLLVAYVFYSAVLTPLESRAGLMRDKTASLQQRAVFNASMQAAVQKSPAAMLEKFYAFFTTDRSVTDQLAGIYNLAQANGLVLKRADYKLLREKDARLAQYQVALPVRGGYLQIRAFAAQVLAEIPTVALDQIRFERKQAGEQDVEAEIKFTLYLVQK